MSDSEEYEVEAIVEHRGTNRDREYLVKWVGYDSSNNTWEPAENLADAQQILDTYLASIKSSRKKHTATTTKKAARTKKSSHQDTIDEFDSDDNESELFITGKKKTLIVAPTRKTRRGDPGDSVDDEDSPPVVKRRRLPRSDMSYDEATDDDEYIDNDEATGGQDSTDNGEATYEVTDEATYEAADDDTDDSCDDVVVGPDGLTRMPYTLKINGVERDIQMIMDKDYPSGDFNWEDKAKRIVGVFGARDDQGGMTGIIEWENGDYSVHKIQQLHVRCPITLIEFYESHASYKTDDSDAESPVRPRPRSQHSSRS